MTGMMETSLHILVVEDDLDIRLATARLLRFAGYHSHGCSTSRCRRRGVLCRRIKADEDLKGIAVMLLSGIRTEVCP